MADIVETLRRCTDDWTREVVRILNDLNPSSVIRLNVVPAEELRTIYGRRLHAWQRGDGPEVENFEQFVASLNTPGDVEFFSVKTDRAHLLVLCRHGAPVTYLKVPVQAGWGTGMK